MSDLHLGHPASLIKDVRQVEPLLAEGSRVVFNGDSVEMRGERVRSEALASFEELKELCRARGVKPFFISGNHDPDISDASHLDLLGGRVFVTHGHALFPDITPWGREARRMGDRRRRMVEEIVGEGEPGMEELLEAVRQTCAQTPIGEGSMPHTKLSWMAAMFSEMAHPFRSLEVFRAWATVPSLASAFLDVHRPEAECCIMGHTHLPGCWKRAGRLVMNTGAFFPWLGRRMVDASEEGVTMRKIDWDGACFRPGKEVLRWSFRPASAGAGEARNEIVVPEQN